MSLCFSFSEVPVSWVGVSLWPAGRGVLDFAEVHPPPAGLWYTLWVFSYGQKQKTLPSESKDIHTGGGSQSCRELCPLHPTQGTAPGPGYGLLFLTVSDRWWPVALFQRPVEHLAGPNEPLQDSENRDQSSPTVQATPSTRWAKNNTSRLLV